MKVNKICDIGLSSLFVTMLLAVMILFFVMPDQEKDLRENRNLKQKDFVINAPLIEIPQNFNLYFNDQFPYRSTAIQFFNKFYLNVYKGFSKDKVVVGKEGWFYMKDKELNAYQAISLYSHDELEKIYKELSYRQEVIEDNGGAFYLFIAPTKYSVYPEFLYPRFISKRDLNKRQQLVQYLQNKGDLKVFDLTEALIQKKDRGRLFHKTDNHWNHLGAYYASEDIMRTLSKDFPDIFVPNERDYHIKIEPVDGKNLVQMMGFKDEIGEEFVMFLSNDSTKLQTGESRSYKAPKNFTYPWDYEKVYVNDTMPDYKMLMVRESFAGYEIQYLGKYFRESVFIFDGWEHKLNKEIVENEQADIVILQIQESFLDNLLPDK
jgi:hypothetical protein